MNTCIDFVTRISKRIIAITLSFTLLVGCGGGGGGGGGGETVPLSGKFIDNFVVNLSYKTTNHSGLTDSTGAYKYDKEGDPVVFSFDGLVLGTGSARSYVTPYDIEDNSGTPVDADNMALFLQSLDQDGDPSNGIVLPISTNGTLPTKIDFNNRAEVEQVITNLGYTPIDITAAVTHLQSSVAEEMNSNLTPGNYKVTTYHAHQYITDLTKTTYPAGWGTKTCNNIMTNVSVAVTDTGVTGLFTDNSNGEIHTFNILFSDNTLLGVTDKGRKVTYRIYDNEYGHLRIHPISEDRTVDSVENCYYHFRLNRDGGLNKPPRAAISMYGDSRGFAGGDLGIAQYLDRREITNTTCKYDANGNPSSCQPLYACVIDNIAQLGFSIEDDDGWLTSATVEWTAGSAGGVIDLLTPSNDVAHFAEKWGYNGVKARLSETDPLIYYPMFFGPYHESWNRDNTAMLPPVAGEHRRSAESNPRSITGVFLTRNNPAGCVVHEYGETAFAIPDMPGQSFVGPVSLTIKVTDNEGYNYSKNYVLNDIEGAVPAADNSNIQAPSGTYKGISAVAHPWAVVSGNIYDFYYYRDIAETCRYHRYRDVANFTSDGNVEVISTDYEYWDFATLSYRVNTKTQTLTLEEFKLVFNGFSGYSSEPADWEGKSFPPPC